VRAQVFIFCGHPEFNVGSKHCLQFSDFFPSFLDLFLQLQLKEGKKERKKEKRLVAGTRN
jgi:hypothetical protein